MIKSIVCVGLLALSAGFAGAGPRGRTAITAFVQGSAASFTDLNGDCQVSDVDIVLAIRNKLVSKYGGDLHVGDLDGDGDITASDLHFAIVELLRIAFGKATPEPGPVGYADVSAVVTGVVTQSEDADVTLDGLTDSTDIAGVLSLVGHEVSEFDLDQYGWEIYDFLGSIQELGVAAFMETECLAGPQGHVEGISNTWPHSPPRWWPSNHFVTISQSYENHQTAVSRSWPANHDFFTSQSWRWGEHSYFQSYNTNNPTNHQQTLSKTWPANHGYTASASWGGNHEVLVSRTWFPGHTKATSDNREFPPGHSDWVSGNWTHGVDVSSNNFPPNHGMTVSQSWGSHNIGPSATFPPNHSTYPSNTWPGPQPGWPPNHAASVSSSWGEPAPSPWPPLFPPDHSWLTTFNAVR